jgi:hypothetical protein
MSMKNSNDTIGNGTRDLPTCSAVPQPTATSANVGGPNVYIIRVTQPLPIRSAGNRELLCSARFRIHMIRCDGRATVRDILKSHRTVKCNSHDHFCSSSHNLSSMNRSSDILKIVPNHKMCRCSHVAARHGSCS